MSKKIPCRIIESEFFTNVAKQVNCRPTTGYVAIYDILRYNPASLTIHGFDFFYSGWFPEYKKGSSLGADVLWKNTPI